MQCPKVKIRPVQEGIQFAQALLGSVGACETSLLFQARDDRIKYTPLVQRRAEIAQSRVRLVRQQRLKFHEQTGLPDARFTRQQCNPALAAGGLLPTA